MMKSMLLLIALAASLSDLGRAGAQPGPAPGRGAAADADAQNFEQGSRLLAQRRFDAAIPLLDAAQNGALSRMSPFDAVTVDRTARLVEALEAGGHARRVADVHRRTFEAAIRRSGEAAALGTDLAVSLASAYLAIGRIAEADALAGNILRRLEESRSADPDFRADVYALLAGISHRRGAAVDSEGYYIRAIDIVVRRPGPNP
jgi:hypothetical protein